MKALSLFFVVLLCSPRCFGDVGMDVYQTFSLDEHTFGVAGEIRVLKDSRLLRSDIQLFKDSPMDIGTAFTGIKKFEKNPPRSAQLLFLNQAKKVIQKITMEKAYASIKQVSLGSRKNFILVTEDDSAGWGSYNGPITRILEVNRQKMQWLKAMDSVKHKKETIVLMKSVKANWKIVQAQSGNDVLVIESLFNPELKESFFTNYIRYHRINDQWIKSVRMKPIAWESNGTDDVFDPKDFPE